MGKNEMSSWQPDVQYTWSGEVDGDAVECKKVTLAFN